MNKKLLFSAFLALIFPAYSLAQPSMKDSFNLINEKRIQKIEVDISAINQRLDRLEKIVNDVNNRIPAVEEKREVSTPPPKKEVAVEQPKAQEITPPQALTQVQRMQQHMQKWNLNFNELYQNTDGRYYYINSDYQVIFCQPAATQQYYQQSQPTYYYQQSAPSYYRGGGGGGFFRGGGGGGGSCGSRG